MPQFVTSMSKRKLALALIGVLAVTGVAVAFWTGAGSGTATGTVGSGGTITVNGTFATGIAPGLTRAVSLTASNPTSSAVQVGTVSLASVAVDAAHSTCAVADFTMPDVVEGQSVAAGGTNVPLANGGTLTMANTAVSQDACKGATLTLTLAST